MCGTCFVAFVPWRGSWPPLLSVVYFLVPKPPLPLLLNKESTRCPPRWHDYSFSLLIPSAVSVEEKVSGPSIQINTSHCHLWNTHCEIITALDGLCVLSHVFLTILPDKNHDCHSTDGKVESREAVTCLRSHR